MELDFTGLDSLAKKQPATTPQERVLGHGEYKNTSEQENTGNGLKTALNGTQELQRRADNQKDAIARATEVYKRYQDNIKATEILQTEILKGVAAGEDIYQLFLKAVKALSLTVSNDLFYKQIEQDLAAQMERKRSAE